MNILEELEKRKFDIIDEMIKFINDPEITTTNRLKALSLLYDKSFADLKQIDTTITAEVETTNYNLSKLSDSDLDLIEKLLNKEVLDDDSN